MDDTSRSRQQAEQERTFKSMQGARWGNNRDRRKSLGKAYQDGSGTLRTLRAADVDGFARFLSRLPPLQQAKLARDNSEAFRHFLFGECSFGRRVGRGDTGATGRDAGVAGREQCIRYWVRLFRHGGRTWRMVVGTGRVGTFFEVVELREGTVLAGGRKLLSALVAFARSVLKAMPDIHAPRPPAVVRRPSSAR